MILQTGGCDMGATSTRSYPISSAFLNASIVVMMPSCSLSGPMTRTGHTLISLLILSFGTAIGHLSPSGSSLGHGAGERPPLHLLLQMRQEGRHRHRAGVTPAASSHGDGAVLLLAVPSDEHVGNLGPLRLPDLQADLLAAQVRFDAKPGLGQATRHVLGIVCVFVRDRDHDGLHGRQPRGEGA